MASLFAKTPRAILPSRIGETNNGETNNDDDFEDNTTSIHRSILNLSENLFEWKNMFKDHAGACCIGSSHGWLILLNTDDVPFLFNPSSSACIHLPPFSHTSMLRAGVNPSYKAESLRITFATKAVLVCNSASPLEYTLAIMYNYPCKLAFCSTKSSTWVGFPDAKSYYCDIVSHNNHLYALAGDGSVQGWEWDFSTQTPFKILDVKPAMEIDEGEEREFPRDKFSSQRYLVVSDGEFLLVKRYIGDFVNAAGEVVYEEYETWHGVQEICPSRTKCFVVYKLDFVKNKWVHKSCLGDRVLFVGANESTSVTAQAYKGCEANSIYFTDDRWEEMDLDSSYDGHDWGVFSLEDKSIKLLTPHTNKMDPPPVWMLPTSVN